VDEYLERLLRLRQHRQAGHRSPHHPLVAPPAPAAYANTLGQLDSIYASRRLVLPFQGMLLVGL
jgi:hypothetical protein